MRTQIISTLIIIILVVSSSAPLMLQAQWRRTNIATTGGTLELLGGDHIYTLYSTNGSLFAGVWLGGLYRSPSGRGNDWQPEGNTNNGSLWRKFIPYRSGLLGVGYGAIAYSSTAGVKADWRRLTTSEMFSVDMSSILPHPNGILIGSYGQGLWATTATVIDSVKNWTKIGNTTMYISSLILADSAFVIGTRGNGVLISSTSTIGNVNSWIERNKGLTNSYVYDMYVGQHGILAATDDGFFLSKSRYGNDWLPWGLQGNEVRKIFPLDNTLFVITTQNGQNRIYYTSVSTATINNKQWQELQGDFQDSQPSSIAKKGDTLFVGTLLGGIFRYFNDEVGWEEINHGTLQPSRVETLVRTNSGLFAASDEGVYRSPSGYGGDWICINRHKNSFNFSLHTNDMVTNGEELFVTVQDGSVLRSVSGNGNDWINVSKGLPIGGNVGFNYIPIISTKNGLFTATASRGVFYSPSGKGDDWVKVSKGISSTTSVYCFAENQYGLFAGTTEDGVYRSLSGKGDDWEYVGLRQKGISKLLNTKFGLYGFNYGDGTWLSPSGKGNDWTRGSYYEIESMVEDDFGMIAGASRGIIYNATPNNVLTWEDAIDEPNDYIESFNKNGQTLFAGANKTGVWKLGQEPMIMVTGATVLSVSSTSATAFLTISNDQNLPVLRKGIVFSEYDLNPAPSLNRYSVTNIPHPDTNKTPFNILLRNLRPNTAYALSGYVTSIDGTHYSAVVKFRTKKASQNITHVSTDSFSLAESMNIKDLIVFPNPMNDVLTIGFNLVNSTKISIRIINTLGQTIASSEEMISSGKYNTSLNTKSLPTGVYIITISDGKSIARTKVVKD